MLINNIIFNANKTNYSSYQQINSKKGLEKNNRLTAGCSDYYNKINISFSGLTFGNNYPSSKYNKDHFRGCLLGGAVGDALGAKIEAWTYEDIKKIFGSKGLQNMLTTNGEAYITDDTQMTLFTALALIRTKLANKGNIEKEQCLEEMTKAYQEWYITQSRLPDNVNDINSNCLLSDKRLYARRSPGITCLESLKISENIGSIQEPKNNSKGSGGVMRCAPIGLLLSDNPDFAFEIGAQSAALTHGNPAGYLPAGALSYLIANIIRGMDIKISVNQTIDKLLNEGEAGYETVHLICKALALSSNSKFDDEEAISQIGKGFTGDEALAIAIYSSLKYSDNYRLGVIASINHSGDSDTTGAITGNILGAYLGEDKIPSKYKNKLELSDVLTQIADDLYFSIIDIKDAQQKYGVTPVFATSEDAMKYDTFDFKSKKIHFSKEDIQKMNSTSLENALKYRSYLIKNKKYTEN